MKRSSVWNRLLSVFLVFTMLLPLAAPAMAAESEGIKITEADNSSIKNPLTSRETADISEEEDAYAPEDEVRVSIFLKKAATIKAGFDTADIAVNQAAMNYRSGLKAEQVALTRKIEQATGETLDVVWNLTLAANLISANVKYGQIEKIKSVKGVEKVVIENQYMPDVVSKSDADPNMATSGEQIGSAAAWAAGYTGAGSKIAIIDTGLDVQHEAFDPDAFEYALSKLDGEYDLLTAEDVAAVLSQLHIAQMGVTADKLYINSKVPFGFSYIDGDYDVSHFTSEHGSHVAGIAAANAYVEAGQEFKPALQATGVQGVAPDAQLLVMKVFDDDGKAYESDYMAAIEDAIILGADSVNLSLGSSNPGYSRNDAYQDVLDGLSESGVVVTISAGNSGGWNDATYYGYLYSDDVSMHTGGSPGTYTNSLCVASVENDGGMYNAFEAAGFEIVYQENLFENEPLYTLAGEYEFVMIESMGKPEDWEAVGDALEGKVAICSRGENTFAEKATAAVEAGAVAVVIYNNQSGSINMDLSGYNYTAPVVSITLNSANTIKSGATAQNGYYTGKMTIRPGVTAVQYNSEYYTMSSFSSWGVPGSLEMKPEITAPGGSICSVAGYTPGGYIYDHKSYETMSGTSMAAPQVAGMVAVLTQYFRESGLVEKTGKDARVLAQSLLMSTAEPVMEEDNGGYYYSILKQGAGLANVGNAVAADSYIWMGADATDSYADGKVKIELGDDPNRYGTYTSTFTINNITDEPLEFKLAADVFTQDVFAWGGNQYMDTWTAPLDAVVTWKINGKSLSLAGTGTELDFDGDGNVTEADGQAILDYLVGQRDALHNESEADLNNDGKVTTYDAYLFFTTASCEDVVVAPMDSVEVEVTISLTDEEKAYLDQNYPNGAYIEAFIYAESVATEEGVAGTCHSIPVLGFYGGWTEASMFEKGSFMEYYYGLETRKPYLYSYNDTQSNSLLIAYADDPSTVYHFGGNPVVLDATYMPERNAVSGVNRDKFYGLYFTSIRNAGDSVLYLKDAATGQYLDTIHTGQTDSAYDYYGWWYNTSDTVRLGMTFERFADNMQLELGLTLIPEYYIDADGNYNLDDLGAGATLSFPFTVDNTAPSLVEGGLKLSQDEKTLIVTASDNQYVAAVVLYDSLGQEVLAYTGADPDADKGETSEFALDITGVDCNGVLLQVIDYAYNAQTYALDIQLGEIVGTVDSVELSKTKLLMQVETNEQLTANVLPANASDRTVTWSSSNTNVATVSDSGVVTAVSTGDATITATSNLDPTKSASCSVSVVKIDVDLNAVIWDENAGVWYAEFNTDELPDYTALSGDLASEDYFVAATVGPNGVIYASSLDTSDGTGVLYTIDPETYAVTKLSDCMVQGQHIFYSDLTYAPAMFGTGALLGTYGPYVIAIDPETGEDIGIIDDFDSYLVGIAACYGQYDADDGVYMDTVYLIQNDGIVIQKIYYGYDGTDVPYGRECASMATGVDVGSAWYYNSAYYDGDYLYWSAFDVENDDNVTLYAIDADDTGNVYNQGTFADDVWPVCGLHQKETAPCLTASSDELDEIQTVVAQQGMHAVKEIQLVKQEISTEPSVKDTQPAKQEISAEPVVKGGLRAVSRDTAAVQTQSDDEFVTVEITAKDAEGIEVKSTNGLITVTYDPELEFGIQSEPEYLAINLPEPGKLLIAYVETSGYDAGEAVVKLLFENPASGTEIEVYHDHYNDKDSGYEETFTVKEQEPAEPFKWHSASVTLGGNIGLNFYAFVPEEILENEDAYVLFTYANDTVKVPVSEAVAAVRDGAEVYRFTCPLTSKNMTDEVSAQLMDGDAAISNAVSKSVKSLAAFLIRTYKDRDPELVDLMKAMLNYGAAAQVLFDYKTDDLANADLSAEDKVLADADASAYAYVRAGSEAGIELNQATLWMDTNTNVRIYFKLTGNKTIDQYTFTIDGKKVTPVQKGNLYYIESNSVGAHNLDKMFTFAVGGLSVKFCALSWANMALNNPNADEVRLNVAKALCAYSAAAEAYIR